MNNFSVGMRQKEHTKANGIILKSSLVLNLLTSTTAHYSLFFVTGHSVALIIEHYTAMTVVNLWYIYVYSDKNKRSAIALQHYYCSDCYIADGRYTLYLLLHDVLQ